MFGNGKMHRRSLTNNANCKEKQTCAVFRDQGLQAFNFKSSAVCLPWCLFASGLLYVSSFQFDFVLLSGIIQLEVGEP